MADRELTANFGAKTSGFDAGTQKIRAQLTQLNTSYAETKQSIAAVNKEIKTLQKEQEQLSKEMKDGGSTEQKNRMNELATAIGQANVKLGELKTQEQGLKNNIKSTTAALEEQSAATNKAKDSLSGLATAAKVLVASYGTKKVFELMFGTNAELEQYTTSFEVMLGNTEKARSLIQGITDMAAVTPLSRADLISNGTLLMNYGVVADDVIETLTKLGDLSSGNAEKLNRISLAYGQMLAKNKVTGEELRQMTEAGVPLIKALAAELNTTTAETQKMISAGTVGIDTLNSAIETLTTGTGKFAGMMEKQSETMNGMLSTLKDYGEQIAQGIGEEGFEKVKSKLAEIIGIIDKAKADGTLDDIIDDIGEKVAGLVDYIINLVGAAWEMRDVITAGITAFVAFKTSIAIGNVISGTVTAIRSFTTATQSATTAQQVFNATGAANPYVLVASSLASLISFIGVFTASCYTASDAEQTTAEAALENVKVARDEIEQIETLTDKYSEITNSTASTTEKKEKLTEIQSDIVKAFGDEATAIDTVNGKYGEQIEKLNELSQKKLEELENEAIVAKNAAKKEFYDPIKLKVTFDEEDIKSGVYDIYRDIENFSLGEKELPSVGAFVETLQFGDVTATTADEAAKVYETIIERLKAAGREDEPVFAEFVSAYNDCIDKSEKLSEAEKQLDDVQNALNGTTEEAADELSGYNETAATTKTTLSALAGECKTLSEAFKEQEQYGSLSIDTLTGLIDGGYAAALSVDEQTGALKLNAAAYRELANAMLDAKTVEFEAEQQTLIAENYSKVAEAASLAAAGVYSEALAIEETVGKNAARIQTLTTSIAAVEQLRNSIGDVTEGNYTGGVGSGGKTEPETDYYKNAYNAYKNYVDAKIDKITELNNAEKKLRDTTLEAIDAEIQSHKRLKEDDDYEEKIAAVEAQLKYKRLDDFTRTALEKQLEELNEEYDELLFQRETADEKAAANDRYEKFSEKANTYKDELSDSTTDVKDVIDAISNNQLDIATAVASLNAIVDKFGENGPIQNILNNISQPNNTVNVTFNETQLTASQKASIIREVTESLYDNQG